MVINDFGQRANPAIRSPAELSSTVFRHIAVASDPPLLLRHADRRYHGLRDRAGDVLRRRRRCPGGGEQGTGHPETNTLCVRACLPTANPPPCSTLDRPPSSDARRPPHARAEQKQGKNVVNVKVEGKCNDKDFSYDSASACYKVGGSKYANRKAIKKALGDLTFTDTKLSFDEASRPSGFGGGGHVTK